ncbi:hypothetical protein VFA_002476 [Vibrio furnissii CIP 102972]|nr:hypothetical protein VFA_002476 [Vibrio furnissii CIP 102972]SUQ32332.1 Uncharacterised protein [Vibrio furnissii]
MAVWLRLVCDRSVVSVNDLDLKANRLCAESPFCRLVNRAVAVLHARVMAALFIHC